MKFFFWAFVALDVVALVTFGLLGLAAAGPSRTNPIAALIIPFFLPGAILLAAIVLFIRAETTGPRLGALLIAALPAILVVGGRGLVEWKLGGFKDDSGTVRQFRSEALRDIEAAIERNDSAAVAAAAPGADLNTPGLAGATVLVLALRHLPKAPDQLGVIRALLAAGADPNVSGAEPPLQPAIGGSRTAGLEPVRLLLEAGADPNARVEGGGPVFFIAGGASIDAGVMELLLAHGADVQLRDRQGRGVVYLPAVVRNWKVLRLLLERGAPWQDQQGPGGMPFRAFVEGEARTGSGGDGLAEVIELLSR